MYKFIKILLAILLCSAIFPALAADLATIPIIARVTDLTNTLTQAEQQDLSAKMANLEQNKGSQIAVLIVPTTQPESIEQYSVRAFAKYKLGRKGVDDGVLLVIAKDDRQMHIEVGYGLEGAIPDVTAKRIIRDYLSPNFKQNNLYKGIDEALSALSARINGEQLPAPTHKSSGGFNWIVLVFMLVTGIFHMVRWQRGYSADSSGAYRSGRFGGFGGGGFGGGGGGGFGGGGGSSGGGGASGGW